MAKHAQHSQALERSSPPGADDRRRLFLQQLREAETEAERDGYVSLDRILPEIDRIIALHDTGV